MPGGQLPVVRHILYLWTGSQCPTDIRNNGEHLASELYQHLQKSVMQVRISEGMEPPHFLQIFNGKLIIFNGKSSDYDPTGTGNRHPSTYLLKVTGDSTFNSKAIQVTGKSAFSSKDCLVLNTMENSIDSYVWVWCGQSSTGDTREIAKSIGSIIGEYSLALESNEPEEFWHYLPDKIEAKLRLAHKSSLDCSGVYGSDTMSGFVDENRVGLFIANTFEPNNICMRQVMAFEQCDLTPEDIYVLDVGSGIFIWTGLLRFVFFYYFHKI